MSVYRIQTGQPLLIRQIFVHEFARTARTARTRLRLVSQTFGYSLSLNYIGCDVNMNVIKGSNSNLLRFICRYKAQPTKIVKYVGYVRTMYL